MAETGTAHRVAVNNTLRWADESASRGEYDDALAWLHVIEAIGDALPAEYESKRIGWRRARIHGFAESIRVHTGGPLP
jgi:hypothetical protein